MQVLQEIHHIEEIPDEGKFITREAVRAVIPVEDKILMIKSTVNGDYKLPGGGKEPGETREDALAREVREECGVLLNRVISALGSVVEYSEAIEEAYDVFQMTSWYYCCDLCETASDFSRKDLDDYEQKLGYRPVWVDINTAFVENSRLLNRDSDKIPRWVRRETFVLKYLKENLQETLK